MGSPSQKPDNGFELIRTREITNLRIEVEEYRHAITGAQHFHIVSDSVENVFMVAFRTVPQDSTGVAHILEHTTLCGSERYPVRDPFFLMIRRSLNTFMNAFTASDYTAYPFASENKQDFKNLLDIYLDAVFFPLLDPLDFAQEGHRLEFESPEDPGSPLQYKGVVYNEMKGDQSSIISLLYETIKTELFPTSTYHHNSGGDPRAIPDLTYEQLVAFHHRHYHPSNAIFMTFGDIPAAEHQANFDELALSRFQRGDDGIRVTPEQTYEAPRQVARPYPVNELKPRQSHVVVGWKLGVNTDLKELIKCNLLSDVLLDTSASPLRFALENTELATAPSPLCGLEESNLDVTFFCGVEGAEQAGNEAVESLILATLTDIAKNGVSLEQLEACLHQLELSHREIGGDGYPYGLQLMFSCLAAAVHRSDPVALLDIDAAITELKEEIHDPAFIPNLIQTYLLDNPHRVCLTLYPDPEYANREQAAVTAELAAKRQSLSEQQLKDIVIRSQDLEARQNRQEPLHLLPKVGVADIGPAKPVPTSRRKEFPGVAFSEYVTGTNGLSYAQVVCDLPELTESQRLLLQVYCQAITEIGSGGRNYLETQALQHSKTGGIACYTALRGAKADPNEFAAKFVLSSRCLTANLPDMNQILADTFMAPAFSEKARIKDLVHQLRIRRDASLTNNGHGLAMTAAAARFRPVAALNHGVSGLRGTIALRELDDSLGLDTSLENLSKQLQAINHAISVQSKEFVLIAEQSCQQTDQLLSPWQLDVAGNSSFACISAAVPLHQAWRTTTQVNHCARVFATVPEQHADAPALAVLAGILRNGYLHRALREQGGAYGGGATSDQSNGLFRFYSYRDPNLEQTFEAFQGAIDWVQTADISYDLIEEAILGIISGLDAPGSPAGEAKQHFMSMQFGRDPAHRQRFRSGVIETTVEDVKRVAAEYLNDNSATAVVTSYEQKLDSRFDLFEL